MVFIAVSWIPKATVQVTWLLWVLVYSVVAPKSVIALFQLLYCLNVQAAIGPLALEFAIERRNEGEIQLGQQVG